jgi:hypothetical protein
LHRLEIDKLEDFSSYWQFLFLFLFYFLFLLFYGDLDSITFITVFLSSYFFFLLSTPLPNGENGEWRLSKSFAAFV